MASIFMLIQPFIPDGVVVALDKGVLLRLSATGNSTLIKGLMFTSVIQKAHTVRLNADEFGPRTAGLLELPKWQRNLWMSASRPLRRSRRNPALPDPTSICRKGIARRFAKSLAY
jgi:hypothetical protein